jgi:cysteinyl-tRNA synthetase
LTEGNEGRFGPISRASGDPGAAELLAERALARDYATSDRLRDELATMGVEVRDTPTGQETARRR